MHKEGLDTDFHAVALAPRGVLSGKDSARSALLQLRAKGRMLQLNSKGLQRHLQTEVCRQARMQQPTRDLWQKVPGYTSDEVVRGGRSEWLSARRAFRARQDEELASREPTPSQLEGRLAEAHCLPATVGVSFRSPCSRVKVLLAASSRGLDRPMMQPKP